MGRTDCVCADWEVKILLLALCLTLAFIPLPRVPPTATAQVQKAVKTRRAKAVLLAPNISSLEGAEAEAKPAGSASDDDGAGAGTDASAPAAAAPASVACPASALIALAEEREVPLVFALSRQKMGKVSKGVRGMRCALRCPLAFSNTTVWPMLQLLGQRKRASCFAILDANGVFDELREMLRLAEEGRRQWRGGDGGDVGSD